MSWVPVGNPVVGTVHGLAGDPENGNVIYGNQVSIVKENTGIWKSLDKGNNWIRYATMMFLDQQRSIRFS